MSYTVYIKYYGLEQGFPKHFAHGSVDQGLEGHTDNQCFALQSSVLDGGEWSASVT